MTQTGRPPTATFLVRLWVENDGELGYAWRGQVEHVQSGEKRYVREMAQVVEFVEERLADQVSGARQKGIR